MHNFSLAADILAGVLALGIPLTGPFERRIYRSNPKTPLKLLTYGVNIVVLWTLAVAAVWMDGWGRLFENPAAGVGWLWSPTVSTIVLGVAVCGYMIAGLLPLIQSLRGLRWRRAYAAAFRRSTSDVPGLFPNTTLEYLAWIPLSLTAGVCEEVLFRGFLIRFLHESGFGLPLAAALVVSSLMFGLGHLYQGFKSVLGTTVAGFGLGLLFMLSGSLIASIVFHVLLDLQIPYVLRPIPEDDAIAAEAV
jgi:membrane protease YdiL (CAAX protease family)